MNSKKLLGLIPARSGSKRLPQKNIKNFCGLPMISWTIKAGQMSKSIDKLIISTDDYEIAEIAEKFGCEVPFIRPKELSTDDATSTDVVFHALQYFPDFTHIILLQPTSPLRQAHHIDEAFSLISSHEDVSCISVKHLNHDQKATYLIDENGFMNLYLNNELMQSNIDSKRACVPNGAIFISPVREFIVEKSLYTKKIKPYFMSYEESVDVDTIQDFNQAEVFQNQKFNIDNGLFELKS